MKKVINLTPHPITICDGAGAVLKVIPPSGQVARLAAKTVRTGQTVDDVPLSRTEFGEPDGLPEPEAGTLLIVSQLIKSALPERTDLAVPAEVVRDEKGVIIGCQSLGL